MHAPSSAQATWLNSGGILVFYVAGVLPCLRQWGSPDPWSRLDAFSGGYLAMTVALVVQQAIFAARFRGRDEIRTVFYSLEIDPDFSRWTVVLGMLEFLVVLDYGQWHLVPWLDNGAIKSAGLALYVLTVAWLFRVDHFLSREFAAAYEQGVPMTRGPYRWVRHPRYLGLFLSRLSLCLTLGSPIGWCLLAPWWLLIRRRVRREERYLRAKFGAAYDDYARGTPALGPRFRPGR